jgi:hypothetical protein
MQTNSPEGPLSHFGSAARAAFDETTMRIRVDLESRPEESIELVDSHADVNLEERGL